MATLILFWKKAGRQRKNILLQKTYFCVLMKNLSQLFVLQMLHEMKLASKSKMHRNKSMLSGAQMFPFDPHKIVRYRNKIPNSWGYPKGHKQAWQTASYLMAICLASLLSSKIFLCIFRAKDFIKETSIKVKERVTKFWCPFVCTFRFLF